MKVKYNSKDHAILTGLILVEKMAIDQIEHWIELKKRNKRVKALLRDTSISQTELMPIHSNAEYKDLDIINQCQNVSAELKSAVSPIIAAAIQDGIVAKNGRNLLECINMTPDMMQACKDNPNFLRGFQMADGKIVNHGKFVPAQFPTPLLAFQLASMITGQYFQNQISEQLSILNKKLDFLINNKFDKDVSLLQSRFTWLNEKMILETYHSIDIGKAESILSELDELRLEYRSTFKRIEFNTNYKFGNNLQEAKKWKECVNASRFEQIIEIAYVAEITYLLANAALYKMYNKYGEDYAKERAPLCVKRHNPNFYIHYAKQYHELKVKLETHLVGLLDTAEFKIDSITRLKKETLKKFEVVETRFSKGGVNLNPKQYLLIDNGECVGIFCETQTTLNV